MDGEALDPSASVLPPRSAFAGFRFPPDVIMVAVRLHLRYNLSYRDVEELLLERGVEVDHVTVFRWVQRFKPLLADAASAENLIRAAQRAYGRLMMVLSDGRS